LHACLPPDSDDDERPARGRSARTPEDEERDHDLNDLADYDGDSDDGDDCSPSAVFDMGQVNATRESDDAVEVNNDDAYTLCEAMDAIDLAKQQSQANAPLLFPGAPPGWTKPSAPKDWKQAPVKARLGEPDIDFKDIDNPGGWDAFTFRPKFLYKERKATKFLHYSLPCGASHVPADNRGNRRVNGFNFYVPQPTNMEE